MAGESLGTRLLKACVPDEAGKYVGDEVDHFENELKQIKTTIEGTLRGSERWADPGKSVAPALAFPEALLLESLQDSLMVRDATQNNGKASRTHAQTLRKAFHWLWKCALSVLLDPGRPDTRRILLNQGVYVFYVSKLARNRVLLELLGYQESGSGGGAGGAEDQCLHRRGDVNVARVAVVAVSLAATAQLVGLLLEACDGLDEEDYTVGMALAVWRRASDAPISGKQVRARMQEERAKRLEQKKLGLQREEEEERKRQEAADQERRRQQEQQRMLREHEERQQQDGSKVATAALARQEQQRREERREEYGRAIDNSVIPPASRVEGGQLSPAQQQQQQQQPEEPGGRLKFVKTAARDRLLRNRVDIQSHNASDDNISNPAAFSGAVAANRARQSQLPPASVGGDAARSAGLPDVSTAAAVQQIPSLKRPIDPYAGISSDSSMYQGDTDAAAVSGVGGAAQGSEFAQRNIPARGSQFVKPRGQKRLEDPARPQVAGGSTASPSPAASGTSQRPWSSQPGPGEAQMNIYQQPALIPSHQDPSYSRSLNQFAAPPPSQEPNRLGTGGETKPTAAFNATLGDQGSRSDGQPSPQPQQMHQQQQQQQQPLPQRSSNPDYLIDQHTQAGNLSHHPSREYPSDQPGGSDASLGATAMHQSPSGSLTSRTRLDTLQAGSTGDVDRMSQSTSEAARLKEASDNLTSRFESIFTEPSSHGETRRNMPAAAAAAQSAQVPTGRSPQMNKATAARSQAPVGSSEGLANLRDHHVAALPSASSADYSNARRIHPAMSMPAGGLQASSSAMTQSAVTRATRRNSDEILEHDEEAAAYSLISTPLSSGIAAGASLPPAAKSPQRHAPASAGPSRTSGSVLAPNFQKMRIERPHSVDPSSKVAGGAVTAHAGGHADANIRSGSSAAAGLARSTSSGPSRAPADSTAHGRSHHAGAAVDAQVQRRNGSEGKGLDDAMRQARNPSEDGNTDEEEMIKSTISMPPSYARSSSHEEKKPAARAGAMPVVTRCKFARCQYELTEDELGATTCPVCNRNL